MAELDHCAEQVSHHGTVETFSSLAHFSHGRVCSHIEQYIEPNWP